MNESSAVVISGIAEEDRDTRGATGSSAAARSGGGARSPSRRARWRSGSDAAAARAAPAAAVALIRDGGDHGTPAARGVLLLGVDLLVDILEPGLQVVDLGRPRTCEMNDWNSSWLALPEAVIGVVCVFGFLKIWMNGSNCGPRCRFGDFAAAGVVGTLASPLASLTSASVSVVMYLTSSHAAA